MLGTTHRRLIVVAVLVALSAIFGLTRFLPGPAGEPHQGMPAAVASAAERLQRAYWRPSPTGLANLRDQDPEGLPWERRLRLLHLLCLDMLSSEEGARQVGSEAGTVATSAPQGEDQELVVRLLHMFEAADSPYRPRAAAVWTNGSEESGDRAPDHEGVLANASLTHTGCIEVVRLENEVPSELAFVPLDDLRAVVLLGGGPFRLGKLFYDDGRPDEVVLVPLLYGISWSTPFERDRDGTLTRFVCAVPGREDEMDRQVGIGHQDLLVGGPSLTLLGVGAVGEIQVALDPGDPRFELKCRARGLDPTQLLRERLPTHGEGSAP